MTTLGEDAPVVVVGALAAAFSADMLLPPGRLASKLTPSLMITLRCRMSTEAKTTCCIERRVSLCGSLQVGKLNGATYVEDEHEEGEDGASLVRVDAGGLALLGLDAREVGGAREEHREREHLQRHHDDDADEEAHSERRLVLAHDHGAAHGEPQDEQHGPDAYKAERFGVGHAAAVVVDRRHDGRQRVHEPEHLRFSIRKPLRWRQAVHPFAKLPAS